MVWLVHHTIVPGVGKGMSKQTEGMWARWKKAFDPWGQPLRERAQMLWIIWGEFDGKEIRYEVNESAKTDRKVPYRRSPEVLRKGVVQRCDRVPSLQKIKTVAIEVT